MKQAQQLLKLLILESNPADAEQIEGVLQRAGLNFLAKRVDAWPDFEAMLETFRPDALLTGYKLAGFTCRDALDFVRRKHPEIPAIIVAETFGEKVATELLGAGARDYVFKDNLLRLPLSVERAISVERGIRTRMAAERKVRESAREIEELYDHAPCGYHSVDASGVILQINETELRWLGYSREEVVKKKKFGDFITAAGQESHRRNFAQFLRTGVVRDLDYDLVRKDGTVFPVRLNSIAIRDAAGGFVRSSATLIDMTERRKADAALAESHRLIEGILNAMPVRVFWKDRDLVYLGCNAIFARDAGFAGPKDLIGKDDYQMGWRNQAELYRQDDRQVIDSNLPKILIEEPQTTPEGKTVTLLTSKIPLRNPQGEAEGVLGAYMDITEYRLAKEAQRASEERYRILFETTSDALFTLEPPAWQFTSANPAGVRLFGAKSEQDLIAHGPWEPSAAYQPDGRPSAEKAREMIEKAMREGTHFFEWTHKRIDGTEFPAEVLLTRVTQDGKSILYASARDISDRKSAEQATRESEERFRNLVESTTDLIWEVDAQSRYTYVSPTCQILLGYEPAELLGRTPYDLMSKEEAERTRALFAGFEAANQPYSLVETRLLRKDGVEIMIESSGVPVFDEKGAVTAYRGIDRDITARKQAEERLRLADLIVENSFTVLYRTVLNEHEKITYVSANVSNFGYRAEDLIGSSIANFVHPDDLEGVERIGRRMIELGMDHAVAEYRVRTGNGSYRWVEDRSRLVRGPDGTPCGSEGLLVDVTARRAAEEVAGRLAAIVESSRSGVIGVGLNGIVTSWNEGAAKIYGYAAEEMIGKPAALLVTPGHLPEFQDGLAKIGRGEDVPALESVRLRRDGKPIDVLQMLSPIRDSEGSIIGASSIVIDITEKKQAERALERATRALRALSQADAALARAHDRETLQQEICRIVHEAGNYRLVWIGQPEHDADKTVRPLAWSGEDRDYVTGLGITWGDSPRGRGPTGMAIKTGRPQLARRVAEGQPEEPWRAAALKRGEYSGLALPLKDKSGVFGVLSIHAAEPDRFEPEEVNLLTELAEDLSYGITTLQLRTEHEDALQKLAGAMEETIQAVAGTVEMRDAYTAGHHRRVTRIAEAIARKMGLSAEKIHGLRLASSIHDLGKINIPAEILSKPGKLAPIEYELIKSHPQVGHDILKNVKFPWPIADIVLQHHERLDGSGYPKGLKGDAILLEAKILAVADVLEAMSSHRPYRPSLGMDAALAEIQKGSGKLYDPSVVEACLRLFRSGKLKVEA